MTIFILSLFFFFLGVIGWGVGLTCWMQEDYNEESLLLPLWGGVFLMVAWLVHPDTKPPKKTPEKVEAVQVEPKQAEGYSDTSLKIYKIDELDESVLLRKEFIIETEKTFFKAEMEEVDVLTETVVIIKDKN